MSTGMDSSWPEGDQPRSGREESTAEQTFADVLNSFSLNSRRGRRKHEGPQKQEATQRPPEPAGRGAGGQDTAGQGPAGQNFTGQGTPRPDAGGQPGEQWRFEPPGLADPGFDAPGFDAPGFGEPGRRAEEDNAAAVRPYAWTGGRTKSDFQLEIETLVSTSDHAVETIDSLQIEHQAVARLCRHSKSVAEVGALLSIPLGVVRVLLGDMARLGLVVVHENTSADPAVPDLALFERVLSGLRRL